MASTYSPKLKFELIGAGEQAGLWGTTTNKNIGELIEQAIAGVTTVDLTGISGIYTLSSLDGTVDQARSAVISCTGTAAAAVDVVIPTSTKLYVFRNACGQTITIRTAGQTGGVTLASGEANSVFCDGALAYPGLVVAGSSVTPVGRGGTGVGDPGFPVAGFLISPGGTTAFTTISAINLSSMVTGQLGVANGGTGISTTPTAGNLLIGTSGGGYAVGSIVGGSGITVTPSSGGITISSSGSSSGVSALYQGTNISLSGGPTGAITVSTSSNPVFSSSVTSPYHYIGSSPGSMYIYDNGGQMQFTVGGVPSAKVTSAGLGCAALVSLGNIYSTGGSVGCDIGGGSSSVQCTNSSTAAVQLGATGFGISRYSNNFAILLGSGIPGSFWQESSGDFYVGAQAFKPGGGSWSNSISDARLKTNVAPLTNALDKILALNPVSYDFLVDNLGEPNVGFIAQEVGQVIPTAVKTRDLNLAVSPEGVPTSPQDIRIAEFLGEDEKTVKTVGFENDMTAYLVGAIKELKAEIDSLKAQLEAK